MSVERVKEFLQPLGYADRVREFEVSSATVPLAALALGVAEARIAKTLSFKIDEERTLLVVAAGDARIDNPLFKAQFGMKARMLSAEEVQKRTGYLPGGVCPFDLFKGVRLCLDESLKRFDTVYPAAGSAASAVQLSPEELHNITQGEWVKVCKLPDETE